VSNPIWGSWPDISYSLTVRILFCGGPSLRRGQVCLLYMLLVLASVVFLGSKSLWIHGHILLSQIWDFPFRRLLRLAGSRWRYSNPPAHGCDSHKLTAVLITSRHWPHRKHRSIIAVQLLPWKHVCLQRRYIATAVVLLLLSGSSHSNGLHAIIFTA
jgi:hypothetical protein